MTHITTTNTKTFVNDKHFNATIIHMNQLYKTIKLCHFIEKCW